MTRLEKLKKGHILVDRYTIEEIIGEGSIGTVYKVSDKSNHSDAQELLAVKSFDVSEQDQAYNELLEKFIKEGKLYRQFSHPNLVRGHDFFQEDGRAFILMELLEGESLEKKVLTAQTDRTFLELDDVTRNMLQVCKAVQYCHDKPVIIRDIKPSNIMILGDGNAKLTDLGIAKFQLTRSGSGTVGMGTIGFAAPEQYGDITHVDERTDVYALGATFYYALTNNMKPLIPCVTDPDKLVFQDSIPESIRKIVKRAANPHSDERYPSVNEMITDLESALAHPKTESRIIRTEVKGNNQGILILDGNTYYLWTPGRTSYSSGELASLDNRAHMQRLITNGNVPILESFYEGCRNPNGADTPSNMTASHLVAIEDGILHLKILNPFSLTHDQIRIAQAFPHASSDNPGIFSEDIVFIDSKFAFPGDFNIFRPRPVAEAFVRNPLRGGFGLLNIIETLFGFNKNLLNIIDHSYVAGNNELHRLNKVSAELSGFKNLTGLSMENHLYLAMNAIKNSQPVIINMIVNYFYQDWRKANKFEIATILSEGSEDIKPNLINYKGKILSISREEINYLSFDDDLRGRILKTFRNFQTYGDIILNMPSAPKFRKRQGERLISMYKTNDQIYVYASSADVGVQGQGTLWNIESNEFYRFPAIPDAISKINGRMYVAHGGSIHELSGEGWKLACDGNKQDGSRINSAQACEIPILTHI